jgi:hypothetical protein
MTGTGATPRGVAITGWRPAQWWALAGPGTGSNGYPELGRGLWAGLVAVFFFKYSNIAQTCKFKYTIFPQSEIILTLHEASFEYDEQFFQLGQLQIPTRIHVIKFGTDSNLNLS